MSDPLTDVLGVVRLTGGVFLSGEFTAPWSIAAAVTADECLPFDLDPQQIIAYHYVVEGNLFVSIGAKAPVRVSAGEIVLLPHNDSHIMSSAVRLAPASPSSLVLPPPVNGIAHVSFGGGGDVCRMMCGFLASEDDFNPLISTLPSLLKLDVARLGNGTWVESSMRFAAAELAQGRPASSNIMSRLSELLFVEAVRNYAAQSAGAEASWIRALGDRQIGRALALMHKALQKPWTTDMLASEAGLSRTVFINRFSAATGVPPLTYLKNWRLRTAKIMLAEQRMNVAQIGYSVGYESEEAFSRAFKKEYGVPPGLFQKSGSISKETA